MGEGFPQRIFAFLRTHRKRIIVGAVICLLLALGLIAALFLYFFLGDDLVLDLSANQTSFRITNAQDAHVAITMRTEGQLFCRTECRLALLDANSRSISVEEINMSTGESVTRDFTLAPGRVGTGQSLYSAVATCRNVETALCPTLAPEWRKTVLLTVNYGLGADEAQVKPVIKAQLEGMLDELRGIDARLKEISAIIAEHPRLRAGHLTGNITGAEERFAQHNLFLENMKLLWSQQSYLPIASTLAASNTTFDALTALRSDVDAIDAEIVALPQRHNALRDRIIAQRDAADALLREHAALGNDTVAAALMAGIVQDTNLLVTTYESDLFPSYAALEADIDGVERNSSDADASLQARRAQVIAIGNAIIIDGQRALCENCSNETLANITSNHTTLSAVCGEMTNATFIGLYCSGNATAFTAALNRTQLTPLIITIPVAESTINATLPEHEPLCCVFGECKPCCSACSGEAYPVLFVHGHSFNSFNSPEYSLGGYFTKIQQRLQEDGYVDAGILTPSSTLDEVDPGEWGLSGRPVTIRATYYYNFYRSDEGYVAITQKSENIETYAIRLNEIIKATQHHTGKRKVTIVAHSMGGLVVRRYLQLFGEDAVDKVILIGTPDNGIEASTKTLCPVFGESKECDDMAKGSVFMRKLNDPANQPSIPFVTITGHGCTVGGKDGDGVVAAESVALPYAKNHDVNGTCGDLFGSEFHTEMLNIDKYPQVYTIIRDELKK